jgi:hypothetical protein
VAEDRAQSDGEHRSEPMPFVSDSHVANGIYPTVKQVEAARCEAVFDRPPADPVGKQLRASDDSVLLPGECRDRPVRDWMLRFAP